MFTTFFAGTLLGISFCVPPGPVSVETVRRGLRGGFFGAFSVQLGSILGDTAWCLLAFAGLAPLVSIPVVRQGLWIAGVLALAWLGIGSLRDGIRPARAALSAVSPEGLHSGGFRSGVALSFANPISLGWWLSIGGAMMAAGVTGTGPVQTALFVAGFIGGTLVWAVAISAGLLFGARRLNSRLHRLITVLCGLVLLGLSVGLAVQAVASSQ